MFNQALIITPHHSCDFGAGVMNRRNIRLISEFSKEQLIYEINLPIKVGFIHKFTKYFTRYKGYIAGLSKEDIKKVDNLIKNNPDIDIVSINSSLFGLMAKYIKKRYPHLKIVFFFHNAEYIYAKELFKTDKSLKNILQVLNHRRAESMSLKNSDIRFILSKRDNTKLQSLAPGVKNCILPMSISDKGRIKYTLNEDKQLQILFVGSVFFANMHGLRWFVKNVMPYVDARLTIVGKDMEKYENEFSAINVDVVGRVDNLKDYYQSTNIVVSPIFLGSGMKTKTVEALMYGVPIIGTRESFSGYDDIDTNLIGRECNDAQEFISAVNFLEKNRYLLMNCAEYARSSYEKYYSIDASIGIMKKCFSKIAN